MKKLLRKRLLFRLKPSAAIEARLANYVGAGRFLWNKVFALNLTRLENKQNLPWYSEMSFCLALWKQLEEYGFLKEAPSQTLQQKLRDLERALKGAFDKKQPLERIPKFEKKGTADILCCPQRFKFDEKNRDLFLLKIRWVVCRKSRSIKGKHWYISIQTEHEQKIHSHTSNSIIEIDMGIKKFTTFSSGKVFKPLNSFAKLKAKLKRYQRRLTKKTKFSTNWKKQKRKIAPLCEHIARARRDYLHKILMEISKNHPMVVVEELQVKNMSKSAKENEESFRKNVKAKSGLNRAILDQRWSIFSSILDYKLEELESQLVKVPPHYPCCKHQAKESRKTQSRFVYESCGHAANANDIGAINILARGQSSINLWSSFVRIFGEAGTNRK
ncbi:MAG: transposase [Candidatus Neptunochlamydia sp.]|nr:transposase [Candidatus Neptunochlamydia sp.]